MTTAPATAPGRAPDRGWRLVALGLVVVHAAAHVAFLLAGRPLDLAPDEAHYWDWSRRPDWAYYSKGPLVAWLIRAGTAAFGDTELGVRLPALACSCLTLAALYALTARATGRERLAALAVGLALTVPVVRAGATLMTIDAPLCAAWAWALVFGHAAAVGRRAWAWPAAGACVGLGLLAKPTVVLWPLSLALFLLAERRPFGRGFLAMLAVAACGAVPLVAWNLGHGWVTLRHVAGTAAGEAPGVLWTGPLTFAGGQAALLLGVWFAAWAAAVAAYRPGSAAPESLRYLWWMSVPTFVVFGLWSLRVPVQLNWPLPAYLAGVPLAAAWLDAGVRAARGPAWLAGIGATAAVGLAASVVMYDTRPLVPALAWLAGRPTDANPMPLRRLDPTTRLRGWRTLADAVDRLRDELGGSPVLAGAYWTLPGELAFYGRGRPEVFCIGPALGERHSQYDLWRPNPVADPDCFRGRTFVIVSTGVPPDLGCAFESIDPPRFVLHEEAGRPVALWAVLVARGFRGFPQRGAGY